VLKFKSKFGRLRFKVHAYYIHHLFSAANITSEIKKKKPSSRMCMLRAILARFKFKKKMAQICLPTSQHLSTSPSSAYSNSKNYQKCFA
jgi:hypothetical protein